MSHCKEGDRCVCGGDTPGVRAGCANWVKTHPDDDAVDAFAAAMKAKLAKKRAEGYGGWEQPSTPPERLAQLLLDHLKKGDPVDIGNFAMMLFHRELGGAALKAAADSSILPF